MSVSDASVGVGPGAGNGTHIDGAEAVTLASLALMSIADSPAPAKSSSVLATDILAEPHALELYVNDTGFDNDQPQARYPLDNGRWNSFLWRYQCEAAP